MEYKKNKTNKKKQNKGTNKNKHIDTENKVVITRGEGVGVG